MRSRTLSYPLLLILITAVICVAGCSSQDTLQLKSGDINALKRIYEVSSWQFRQSRLNFQVHQTNAADQTGAVEIVLEGEAVQKAAGQEGPLLLPVALVRQLPDYLQATDLSNQSSVELQAYKVVDGLWCITALVPLSATSENPPALPAPRSNHVQLKLLLVSPEFESKLPLLIPAEQSRSSVDLSVNLPQGAKFESQDIRSYGPYTGEGSKLTVLPSSLTGGSIRAVARLLPESAIAWDFSRITYIKSSSIYFSPSIILLSLLTLIMGITLFYWMKITRYRKDYSKTSTNDEDDDRLTYRIRAKELFGISSLIISLLLVPIIYFTVRGAQGNQRPITPLTVITILSALVSLIGVMFLYWRWAIQYQGRYRKKYYYLKRWVSRRRYLIITILIIGLTLMAIAYVIVRGAQGDQQLAQNGSPEKVAALGDFGMTVVANNSQPNKVTVILDFLALTDRSSQGMEEVGIGTGDNNNAEMEDVKVTPSDNAKIIQLSRKQARFIVPTSYIPSLTVLRALSDSQIQIEKVRITDNLQAALNDKGNLVKMEYVLTKVLENKNHIGGWLHSFPFDYKTLVIPIKLQQPAIVSKIELPEQEGFVTTISTKGISDAIFVQSNNTYQLNLGRRESRITIPASGEVTFEVTYQRSGMQLLILTLGQIVLAIIGGLFLGLIASLPSSSQVGTIIGAIGLVGLPYLMRSSVFSTYKDLPSLLSGQSPTVFELIFIFSLIIYAVVAWKSWKGRTQKKKVRRARGY
jgi:hypothetical protein